jgi:phosphoglucomutase/phosphomannomutase
LAQQNDNLLAAARTGFQSLPVDGKLKEKALVHLSDWLTRDKLAGLLPPETAGYHPLLAWMIGSGKFSLLLDSFYQVMPFGTGGRRGPVGIGPNRINPFTMASSVQGHVAYLRERFGPQTELKVVVACDVRRYGDLRGIYPSEPPNPVLGLSSKDFAHIATSVYCAGGVRVYLLDDELNDYISTPELSFLIQRYGAHGGLNVSASHNHPDDNGGKFYNDRGGQEIPPRDEQMVKIVEAITEITSMPYAEALRSGQVEPITVADRRAYIDLNLGLRLRAGAGAAKIVYTPLHGTGRNTVGACLEAMGFKEGRQLFTVASQREYRGDFANVRFRAPNPEVPESLEAAIEVAREVGADLILATDPDADRIGGAAPWRGKYEFIQGNELAAVVTRYRLESLRGAGKLPERPLVLKTQVTTELMAKIAESFGAQVIGNLLVGFKYVGDVLDHLERDGGFGDIEASLEDFVIAAEESHGLLLTPQIRDKDAAGAAVVLAELVSELKESDGSFYEYLIDTYKRYGYHRNLLRSTIMQGAAGTAAIARIQQALRESPPTEVAGLKRIGINDYWDLGAYGPFLSETDRGSRNFLTFFFEGGLKVSIRPSGTEPKNKVYIEKCSDPLGAAATDEAFWDARGKIDEEVEAFSGVFMKSMLSIIGVELPDYCYLISDLVSLERKRHFAETFLPELESRAAAFLRSGTTSPGTTSAAVGAWIGTELGTYGPDARLLVDRAFRSYVKSEAEREPAKREVIQAAGKLFTAPRQ